MKSAASNEQCATSQRRRIRNNLSLLPKPSLGGKKALLGLKTFHFYQIYMFFLYNEECWSSHRRQIGASLLLPRGDVWGGVHGHGGQR